jgi:hypothetical protein
MGAKECFLTLEGHFRPQNRVTAATRLLPEPMRENTPKNGLLTLQNPCFRGYLSFKTVC